MDGTCKGTEKWIMFKEVQYAELALAMGSNKRGNQKVRQVTDYESPYLKNNDCYYVKENTTDSKETTIFSLRQRNYIEMGGGRKRETETGRLAVLGDMPYWRKRLTSGAGFEVSFP